MSETKKFEIKTEPGGFAKPTPHTPVYVKVEKEELKRAFDDLDLNPFGQGLSWRFVRPNKIKYYDDDEEEWKYKTVTPKEIIRRKDLKDKKLNEVA